MENDDDNTHQPKKSKLDYKIEDDGRSEEKNATVVIMPSNKASTDDLHVIKITNNNADSPTSVGEIVIGNEMEKVQSNDEDITDNNENVASTSGTVSQSETVNKPRRFRLRRYRSSPSSSSSSSSDNEENVSNHENNGQNEIETAENNEEELIASASSPDSSDSSHSDSDIDISTDSYNSDVEFESDNAESDAPNDVKVDLSEMKCLKAENLRHKWNTVRELEIRSLGLSKRKHVFIPNMFQSRAYGSLYMVERLGLMHKLDKHDGCVNCLDFNSSGKLLVSGSDDCKIIIWDWKLKKALKTISSGHKSNIFQSKFMESYGDTISIVTSARDGQVRHIHVDPAGTASITKLFEQNNPVHKLAIPPQNPHEILTAGEDGVVRCYDMRKPGGNKILKIKKRLYSIAAHPYENEFCVSGNDKLVRVYDRRDTRKPFKVFCPDHMKTVENNTDYKTVTCCVYNDTGDEILASYGEEDIYLFNNGKNNESVTKLHSYSGHNNCKTIKGVNFLGKSSEYVVSGSDCGHIFIWDKETETIAKWMKGDVAGVVNVLESHPEFPILATSGLDSDVKIWTPMGDTKEKEDKDLEEQTKKLEKIIQRNMRLRRNRSDNEFDDRILDFLIYSRMRNARVNRHLDSTSSDSDRDSDDEDGDLDHGRSLLQCNPS